MYGASPLPSRGCVPNPFANCAPQSSSSLHRPPDWGVHVLIRWVVVTFCGQNVRESHSSAPVPVLPTRRLLEPCDDLLETANAEGATRAHTPKPAPPPDKTPKAPAGPQRSRALSRTLGSLPHPWAGGGSPTDVQRGRGPRCSQQGPRLPRASLRSGLCHQPLSGVVRDNQGENASLGGGGELGLVSELTAGSLRQVNFLLANSGNNQRSGFSGEIPEQTGRHRAVHSRVHGAPCMTAGLIIHTAAPAHSWVPSLPLTPALPGQLCAPEATRRLRAALGPPAPPPRALQAGHTWARRALSGRGASVW